MSDCLICGAWAPDDQETGYRADSLCPRCQEEVDNWQECDAALYPPDASSQADGHAEPIKSICCVCQVHLRGPVDATVISHGLCSDCFQKQMKLLEAECPF